MTRTILTDKDWEKIKPLLPQKKTKRGRPPKDNRTVIEGVLWILRTGAPWRDLPQDFGKWKTVYTRFRRWSLNGVWEKIWGILKKRVGRRITYDRCDYRACPPTRHVCDQKGYAIRAGNRQISGRQNN